MLKFRRDLGLSQVVIDHVDEKILELSEEIATAYLYCGENELRKKMELVIATLQKVGDDLGDISEMLHLKIQAEASRRNIHLAE